MKGTIIVLNQMASKAPSKRKRPASPDGASKRRSVNDGTRILVREHYDLKDGLPVLTTALTGAAAGDLLTGVVRENSGSSNDSEGVVLQVLSGCILASHVICQSLADDDLLVRAYMRDYGLSRDVAMTQVRSRHMTDPNMGNAHAIGSSCPNDRGQCGVYGDRDGVVCNHPPMATFRILEPGVWVTIADEMGGQQNKDQLMEYVLNGTELTWRQILLLFGNKSLMLRARLFAVTHGPRVVAVPHANAYYCVLLPDEATVTYEITKTLQLTVNVGAQQPEPNTKERVLELVQLACPEADAASLSLIYDTLQPLTNGALKSALQKTVRFGARAVALGGTRLVAACDYAAVVCCMLALSPGGFVPQIQQMVRGVVAALKRAVVIMIEDAYAGTPQVLQGLFGTALVCQRVSSFHPRTSIITLCINLMWKATRSNVLIDWRPYEKGVDTLLFRQLPPTVITEHLPSTAAEAEAFGRLPGLLEELRSFQGDIVMMQTVAALAKRKQGLPMVYCQTHPDVMPDCHMMDQHTQPGIGHVMLAPGMEAFQQRFTRLFGEVTGMNPRKDDLSGFEERDIVRVARFAQQVIMQFVTNQARAELPVQAQRLEHYQIDPGTLAAGVGPVDVKVKLVNRKQRELVVVLPTFWPADGTPPTEVVMLRPSRSKVDDYFEWGNKKNPEELEQSELERQAARLQVREKSLVVRSPLLPAGRAMFRHGQWYFQDQPWTTWMANGVPVTVHTHNAPVWPMPLAPDLLHNNAVLSEALGVVGTGLCADARETILTLCDVMPPAVVARAHGLLRQQFERFVMPVPARDGGLGADQLQAYPGDWDVWRLLVLMARWVPGALRPSIPPRFDVPNAVLLSMVSSWISSRRLWTPPVGAPVSPWMSKAAWRQGYTRAQGILRQHQRDAVERMKQRHHRGAPGHYLVMDTGHGKTYTAVTYAMWRLLETDLGHQVHRIIWVTPPGEKLNKQGKASDPYNYQLIASLMDEFDNEEALIPLPVTFVNKKAGSLEAMFPMYTICIVHHDHLRDMAEELAQMASSSFIIFDEGDNLYGPSLRTSAALRTARLSPEFIIQTATPVPGSGKIDRLAEWLGLTEEYPVSAKNYLVAACNMVSLKISLGIDSHYLEFAVPRSEGAEAAFRDYVGNKDWGRLFKGLQNETNAAFCQRAFHYATLDRAQTPTGGCFVVCEGNSHVQALIALFRTMFPETPCGDASLMADPLVHVVFVASSNCRGYNEGVRLGVQIRQPYPGSAAARQQMEGRIRRMNQQREAITYEVVYMVDTFMHLLHDRQQRDDNANHSLDQLAEEYDRTVLGQ